MELIEADTSDFTVKMRNLAEGTERDVVRFFAKRIKCGCLKRRSRKIKNEPKCKFSFFVVQVLNGICTSLIASLP